jgi:hypothetical protein
MTDCCFTVFAKPFAEPFTEPFTEWGDSECASLSKQCEQKLSRDASFLSRIEWE